MAAVSPMTQLREIESKSLAKKALVSTEARHFTQWRGVGFRVGDLEVVASMSNVVEVLKPVECTRVPSSKAWFEGIANIRGLLVPVTDLYGFLYGEDRRPPTHSARIVVFRLTNTVAGLYVTGVTGIRSFRKDSIDNEYPEIPEQLKPFLIGCFHHAGDHFPVFDFNRLVSNERFMHVAEKIDT